MKRLIVNADDFGLAETINAGIIKGHKEGFITSTSLMCSAPAFEQAVALARQCPTLGLGIHLTLVGGVRPVLPAAQVPSLLDSKGLFPANYGIFAKRFYTGQIKGQELRRELVAQIERGLATGLSFTHVDSHQHLHVLPGMQGLIVELCERYGFKAVRTPAEAFLWKGGFSCGWGRVVGKCALTFCAELFRWKLGRTSLVTPQHFFGMLAGGNLNEALVANILQGLPEGTSEIMTHPGLDAAHLGQRFTWGYHWEDELQAFLAVKNKNILAENKIQLINFGGLLNA